MFIFLSDGSLSTNNRTSKSDTFITIQFLFVNVIFFGDCLKKITIVVWFGNITFGIKPGCT